MSVPDEKRFEEVDTLVTAAVKAAVELLAETAGLPKENAERLLALKLARVPEGEQTLWAESFVGAKSGKPGVNLTWNAQTMQMRTEDARRFALTVIQAAEAAEFDCTLLKLLRAKGIDDSEAFHMIAELRTYRS